MLSAHIYFSFARVRYNYLVSAIHPAFLLITPSIFFLPQQLE
jgi:hypothetical protein